jgi:hypothetical protein
MLTPAARLTLRGNNLLDNDRIYASGYSYLFLDDGGRISGTPYYFPQATRNFVLLLDFRL